MSLLAAAIVIGLYPGAFTCLLHAQGADRSSLAGEGMAEYLKRMRPDDYNLRWGDARFKTESSLGIQYNDNVFLANSSRQSDVIISPEVTLSGFLPVTDVNTLNFSIGVGYNYYLQTPELNANRPEINPGTEFAFTVFIGDVRLKFFNRFEYQDTVQTSTTTYASGADFISLSNVELFSRLDNQVGLLADWDLHDLILSGAFTHENFVSFTEAYDYLTRASEQLRLAALFLPGGKIRPGFEIPMQYDDYKTEGIADVWRFTAGPTVEVTLTPNFNFRAGAGVQWVNFEGQSNATNDLVDYEAYLRLNHRVNEWMRHSLEAVHVNAPGWNAGNAAITSFGYRPVFTFLRDTTMSAYVSWNRQDQTGGTSQQNIDYILASLNLAYRLSQRATLEGFYYFTQLTSNQPLNDYTQNRVGAQFVWQF